MIILKANGLSKEWNGTPLFQNISFEVNAMERIALFGRNGIGKTTLLNGLIGRIQFEAGSVYRGIPLEEWGWLDQQVEVDPLLTVQEFVQSASNELFNIKQELKDLNEALSRYSSLTEKDQPVNMIDKHVSLESVMESYSVCMERYIQLDGFAWESRVEKIMRRMRLDPSLWGLPFSQLSGGQKTRAQFASLIVREPKLILLDEPTNHLDEETLDWLEQWVQTYPGTIIYVSHDREFIDRTASAVIELSNDGCRHYAGGYTSYRMQKEVEQRTQESLLKKEEQEREKLLESIRRYAEWFQQAHDAAGQNDFLRSKSKKNVSRLHAKEKALERLEQDHTDKPREAAQLRMQLTGEAFSAATMLRLEGVSFSYPNEQAIIQSFSMTVKRGERVAVLGANGAGKSTLLKVATGLLTPTSGAVQLHPQTIIGYFAQELDNLDVEETLLDSLLKLSDMTQTQARTILGCFLFSREDVFKRIGDLSMGEKCRVAFLKLFFGQSNLLVLDEPTNYLDIDTRERVEDALCEYPGAILIVSHDRYLIRKLANRLVLMKHQEAPKLYPGTYEEYQSKDRGRLFSTEEQGQENEREVFKLRLAQLMSQEESDDPVEQERLMKEIRQIHKRLY